MDESTGIPRHVAIIMDGNGRWGKNRGLSRLEGHRAGVRNIRSVTERLNHHGVTYVTLYTFSTENWQRPREEVNGLLKLLKDIIADEAREMHKNNMIIHHVGSLEGLDDDLVKKIKRAVKLTARNTGMHVATAFNYGGRMEIVNAARRIIREGVAPETLTEESFASYLYTAGFPEVDLVIRTGGEIRTSNFLIWQAAYAEYYFTPVLWPDFTPDDVDEAIRVYGERQRRFGRLGL